MLGLTFGGNVGKITEDESLKEDEVTSPTVRTSLVQEDSFSLKTKSLIGQPLFHGDSFMVLPKLPSTARKSLELTITFKARAEDGLLLFSGGKTRKHKDFIALALRKRKVELRLVFCHAPQKYRLRH